MIFDVLRVDGRDVIDLPWRERRQLARAPRARGSDLADARPSSKADADAALSTAAAARSRGDRREAHRLAVPARASGRRRGRSEAHATARSSSSAGGCPVRAGSRGTLGSLLVGYYERAGVDAARLRGTRRVRARRRGARCARVPARRARRRARSSRTPKLDGAVWVEPDVVAEVEFSEWTEDGVLRQPVFLGLRVDKDPADVVREP